MKKIGLKVVCIFLLLGSICMNVTNVSQARFNMSYLYGSYDYISLVERTNGALNEVSPSYFDLNSDGSLNLNTVDSKLVEEMHKKGITVVPFLSNHWDRTKGRLALSNKEKLTNQIVQAVNKYNLDGVNVDLENLTESDRNNYVEFVKLLREKLPAGKSVSVAVAANPYGWNSGWQGSYDYKKLAQYADYIMLMAYDEHYEGGEAGPVASIEFVENSIKYALEYVDKSKLVLGIPFYGRYWNNDTGVGGYGVRNTKVEDIINKYSSYVTFDEKTQSPKAVVTIKNGELCPVINGRALKAGTYVFWYENEESITKKLELVNKYDLKGSGSWSLGQENANTWEYYKKVLEGNNDSFYDVSDNYWAHDAIYLAKENGWIEGRSKNSFEPEGFLTRAEFSVLLCRVLGYSTESNGYFYNDTKEHWANGAINTLTQAKLMDGYGNGLFLPDKVITREEVVKVLYYLVNEKSTINGKDFKDVSVNRWSYEYIEKMSSLGVINGYEDGEFKPENPIKRSEIVTILQRLFA